MKKGKHLEGSLCDRIIAIAGTSSSGFFGISVKADKGIIKVFYEKDEKTKSDFFSVDIPKKELYFNQSPRAHLTEFCCIELAKYLQEEGYKVKGVDHFIQNPQFEIGEISLY